MKKSKFFKFKKKSFSKFLGWNNLQVVKVEINNNINFDSRFLINKNLIFYNQEKIIVVTKGKIEIKIGKRKYLLSKFDAINFLLKNKKTFECKSLKKTEFYIICSKTLKRSLSKINLFNFKTDINKRDLWGGQCISRPYEGKDITLVLFDLKKGFTFNDKGHKNEQITWLINGEMNFYVNDKSRTLKRGYGVDIGPNHSHGGVSNGAVGFDAFFPKREEKRYKKLN